MKLLHSHFPSRAHYSAQSMPVVATLCIPKFQRTRDDPMGPLHSQFYSHRNPICIIPSLLSICAPFLPNLDSRLPLLLWDWSLCPLDVPPFLPLLSSILLFTQI